MAESSAAPQAVSDARLFASDALRAAREVMSGNPASAEGSAYLAVFTLLAAAALFPGMEVAGRVCAVPRDA